MAYVSIDSEYSDIFQLHSGVLQGAATSTILFIAYTSDVITLIQFLCVESLFIHTTCSCMQMIL